MSPNLGPSQRLAWVFLLLLAPIHLFLISSTVGLRPEHFVVDGLCFALLIQPHLRLRRFAALALPFWGVGALYESLPLILPLRGAIHIGDLYQAELDWFGIESVAAEGSRAVLIPSAYLGRFLNPVLDALCGFAYLVYLAETFAFAGYLYFRDQTRMARLTFGFFLLNVAGMITYVLYPAAPPWYVEQYGVGPAVLDALPSAARTARFDALFDTQVFASFYARNVNVFGAMPSLHCAYPTLVFWVVRPLGKRFAIPTGIFALWIAFSAVYLNHHYVLDALAGFLYATLLHAALVAIQRRLAKPTGLISSLGKFEHAVRK